MIPANQNPSPLDRSLRKLRDEARDLIKVIDLELSGARDVDGHWLGSDALDGRLANMLRLTDETLRRHRGSMQAPPRKFVPDAFIRGGDDEEIPF